MQGQKIHTLVGSEPFNKFILSLKEDVVYISCIILESVEIQEVMTNIYYLYIQKYDKNNYH